MTEDVYATKTQNLSWQPEDDGWHDADGGYEGVIASLVTAGRVAVL